MNNSIMSDDIVKSSIFLIVEFNWPSETTPEMYSAAGDLHKTVVAAGWIEEILAGFGGIGPGRASIWVFKMSSYGDLDKIANSYKTDQNEVSKSYSKFFEMMEDVEEKIREEVIFV